MTERQTQEAAAKRVAHLHADEIRCRFCGEQSASTPSFKGYAHRWGPTKHHVFIARKPSPAIAPDFTATRIPCDLPGHPSDCFGPDHSQRFRSA